MSDDIAPFLPLSNAARYILLSVAREPRHGYGIIQDVSRLSDQRYKIGPGTLYDNLEKLMDGGLVREANPARVGRSTRKRRYELTHFGHQVLAADVDQLKTLVREANQTLKLAEGRNSR
jgi:PadR family transcriptional regulator, regulatory protein PadR